MMNTSLYTTTPQRIESITMELMQLCKTEPRDVRSAASVRRLETLGSVVNALIKQGSTHERKRALPAC